MHWSYAFVCPHCHVSELGALLHDVARILADADSPHRYRDRAIAEVLLQPLDILSLGHDALGHYSEAPVLATGHPRFSLSLCHCQDVFFLTTAASALGATRGVPP